MGTNTGIGIGIGIPFKNNALGGDRPYLPPELKARLIGVWDNYGKKNTDADRNIIKNKIPNAGGDLEILNAAYEGMSGCNGYPVIFGINKTWKQLPTYNSIYSINDNKIHITKVLGANRGLIFSYVKQNDQLLDITEIPSFKIRVSGLKGDSKLRYSYIKTENAVYQSLLDLDNGIHELPKSLAPTDSISNNNWIGFTVTPRIENETSFDCDITIEILPEYEGAFVTDGVSDMIISQKTLQEMGVTKDFTIVSMIHQITLRGATAAALTNYIRKPIGYEYVRNHVANIGKTGIYGYVVYDVNHSSASNSHIINTILGDKNDYSIHITGNLSQGKFSVQGYINGEDNVVETSRVAHYWTFALLGKATEDDINLIIGYFNLDRTLKADIYCNIERQGITNDNHAEFNDKLIDYSGNGRDLQLFNIGWKGESGVGRYTEEFKNDYWLVQFLQTGVIKDSNSIKVVGKLSNAYLLYHIREVSTNAFKVKITGIKDKIRYSYILSGKENNVYFSVDGIYDIPASESIEENKSSCGFYINDASVALDWIGLTIEIIPSNKGALCLDGINDFGKVINMPIYKDYTIIIDYIRTKININTESSSDACVLSKSELQSVGAFMFNLISGNREDVSYSFGHRNIVNIDDTIRAIYYQSKYINNGQNIDIESTFVDSDKLWLGTFRDNDSRFLNGAIYFLMSFPYSMSKFLIERQLKKHKLGTLYSDMVEFRPIVKSNVKYQDIIFRNTSTGEDLVAGQYYDLEAISIFIKPNNIDEVSNVRVNNTNAQFHSYDSNSGYYYYDVLINKSPQKINITIDEYIRYEDIVQPYPVLLRFKDESGKEVSWGDKIKLGSSITRIGSFNDCNLLKDIYTVSNAKLNGNSLTSTPHVVERQMVFTCTATWIFDDNEPNCILSPRLLHAPNSSYKILGHIPDISGHGNHGVIYNSAYKLNSGVNGYLVDFTTLKDDGIKGIVRTDSKIYLDKSFNYNQGFWLGRTNNPSPAYKVKVSGIPETGMLTYTGGVWLNLVNGINELPARTNTEEEHGFVIQSPNLDWSNLVIEQIGEYEGAYCLDGIDDFITIPTLSKGGKQVLMKVNWSTLNRFIYDQRPASGDKTFGIYAQGDVIAYSQNNNGNTYIDGIINNNIIGSNLSKITHNIVATCDVDNSITPSIGKLSYSNNYFAQMSLYDFMLFDEISTEDKIKELNEYVGIEAKVELPPYYWDAYGKSNLDEDRDSIKQRGVAVGDYDLTNYNHAYNKMSGYGGYSFKSFNDSQDWNIRGDGTGVEIVSRDGYSITIKKLIQNLDWQISNNEYRYPTILDKELPFKCISNKKVGLIWQLKYKTEGATSDTAVTLINQQLTPNVPLEINLPYKTQDELTELGAVSTSVYYLLYFSNTTLEIGEEYTVEMLPLYPNGLVYDAITDYSENVNIPVFTDFTAIMKRKWLKNQGCPLIKGSKVYEGGNGNALLFEWDKAYNFVFYKRTDIMEGKVPENISFITPTNYNGNVITRGSGQDTNGICIAGDGNAGFANIVFYKLILYPKTIPLLQINFLKNLMERDEIIDLNNPIFIKNE
jgi:hypothetical protein